MQMIPFWEKRKTRAIISRRSIAGSALGPPIDAGLLHDYSCMVHPIGPIVYNTGLMTYPS